MSLHDRLIRPEGPKDADVYILGESGGKKEAAEGRPFIGQAGQELNGWLGTVNIQRSRCRVNNSYPWLPKGKKVDAFFKDGDGHSIPTDRFMDGLDRLVADLKEVRPNVVAAFGNYALWAMYQVWGITKWQGSILESRLIPGQKFIPVIHPAAVRRNYKWKPLAIWHMERVREESKTSYLDLPQRDFILDPTQRQIDEAVERLLSGSHITFDTEWYTPRDLACIGFTNSPDWAICIPADHPGAIPAYEELLGSDLPKVAQNAMFDVTYLRAAGVKVKTWKEVEEVPEEASVVDQIVARSKASRLVEDTMVAHHVCWPDIRNRLERLTCIYTREPYYKEEFKVWEEEEAQGLDRAENSLHIYNSKDTSVTDECWEALRGERELCGTDRAYEFNMLTMDIMARAALKGVKADWGALMTMRRKNELEANELHSMLCEIIGWDLNTRSWVDVKKLVYGQLGIRERKRKPTAQETLMDIAAQEADRDTQTILKTLIKIRQLRNQNSRYVHPCAVDEDGRIRCSWNMAGTKNGRLSASKDKFKDCPGPGGFKGRGLPLQTIPHKVRKVFVADPGHVFIIPDLEQAEAREVAYLSNDTRVLRWLEEGLDIHAKLAEIMFNVGYEEILEEKKRGPVEGRKVASPRRYLAKTCRHALNYMMGVRTFKATVNEDFIETDIGITESEARTLREQYLTIHSPLEAWWNEVKSELGRNRQTLTSPLGRTRRFIDRWGGTMFRDGIAFIPQSTIGDLTHLGLFEVDRRLPYAEVLLNIHDGSVIQVPIDKAEEAGEVVKDALSIPHTVNGYEVVIPVEVKYGLNWGEPVSSLDQLDL